MTNVENFTKKSTSAVAVTGVILILGLIASTITLGVLYAQERNDNQSFLRGTVPPQAVTMWWVIFNRPENCITNPDAEIKCGSNDLLGEEFVKTQQAGAPDLSKIAPNVDAGATALYGTGAITDSVSGAMRLQASIYKSSENDTPLSLPAPLDPLGQGTALIDPDNAEVHAIIRSHGNYIDVTQTLGHDDDYCTDPNFLYVGSKSEGTGNICASIQSVAFGPGKDGSKPLAKMGTTDTIPGSEALLIRQGDALQMVLKSSI